MDGGSLIRVRLERGQLVAATFRVEHGKPWAIYHSYIVKEQNCNDSRAK